MSKEYDGIFEDGGTVVPVREKLTGYLSNWPLFLISIVLCIGAGLLKISYTVPKYMASTSFLIKDATPSRDLIESVINVKTDVSMSNEMLLIGSNSFMQRTVAKNDFNVSYFEKGSTFDTEIYKDAPFTLSAKQLTDSNRTYTFYIKKIHRVGGEFIVGTESNEKLISFLWNKPFTVNRQIFVLTPRTKIESEEVQYIVKWQPVPVAAGRILNNLTVKPFDTKSSAVQLLLKTENLQKGKDILNALFAEYNLSDLETQEKLTERTVQFIDDRLFKISGELKGVEGNLENYQGSQQLVDIKSQSNLSLEKSNAVTGTIKDLKIQQGVASMILEYFTHPVKDSKLVPSSLGLNDATLASLITQYNELQIKKDREAPSVAPNSTVMQDLNAQINNIKESIMESLNNITRNLQLRENDFQQQNNQTRSFLSSIPHNERVLQEIRRKQNITEGLYLYLLQKREEGAISSAALNVTHYRQIDPALAYGPVEPNTKNIIMYTALLGLLLPVSWLYLRDNFLNDKITTLADITNKVALPILGQLSHVHKKNKPVIAVLGRDFIGEEFRSIRAKISFLLKDKNERVILVTSSLSNEGKSFISLNLAAVCAIPGKKVALLGFDFRNPSVVTTLRLNNSKGLATFLSGEVKTLSEISFETKEIPTLHIYPAGSVSLNPADLMLSENIKRLFQILREKYDYIIIDSPPVGLVSDAFLLDPYCEMVIYVLRQKITLKSQLDKINHIKNASNLNNIHLILNDVKTGTDKGYYSDSGDFSYTKITNSSRIKKSLSKVFNF